MELPVSRCGTYFDTTSTRSLHAAFSSLQDELAERGSDAGDPGAHYDERDDPVPFEFSIANFLWGQDGYPFEEAFRDLIEAHYGGSWHEVDFTADPEGVRREINEWVAAETGERIDPLLPEGALDTLTRLVVVNAIYFLTNWKYPFSSSATEEASFTALGGAEHEVMMMRNQGVWPYAEIEGVQAVELPYVGDEVSMLVILPPQGRFEVYERSFDGDTLAQVAAALEPREGTIRLPRFEYESGIELGGIFRAMGMEDAFDPDRANFGAVAHPDEDGRDLHIVEVYHDAVVAVDEEGTEAAAATGVVITDTSAPADPFSFDAKRPFLFVIRDRPTESVLFLGRVIDPAGWE